MLDLAGLFERDDFLAGLVLPVFAGLFDRPRIGESKGVSAGKLIPRESTGSPGHTLGEGLEILCRPSAAFAGLFDLALVADGAAGD